MFWKYSKKHKRKFVISKIIVVVLILAALVSAGFISGIELPRRVEKWGFGSGVVLLLTLGMLVIFDQIKWLFKVRSVGFMVVFGTLLLLSLAIETLLWGLGLVIIPLLLDDYFMAKFHILNMTEYWEDYKFIYGRKE